MSELSLKKIIRPFEKKRNDLAVRQIFSCIIPIAIVYACIFYAVNNSLWLMLSVLSFLQALFHVRLFIIFHDCAHNNFFTEHKWNLIVGHIIGWITLVPLSVWNHIHNRHHEGASNLDHRNILDVLTYTKKEYDKMPLLHRMGYLFFRSAFFQLFIYTQFTFLIAFRFPIPLFGRKGMIGIVVHNLLYLIAIGIMLLFFSWQTLVLTFLPTYFLLYGIGSLIFFVQHQFEEVHWSRNENYDFMKAGIEGSSFWDLPAIGHWFTGNIGFHHIHHLNIGIPNYHLKAAHKTIFPHIEDRLVILPFWKSLTLFSYKLYDEESGKLVRL